jgi:hypothetical protein
VGQTFLSAKQARREWLRALDQKQKPADLQQIGGLCVLRIFQD